MGFLDIFKKKKDDFSYESASDAGLGDDPFKSDPLMDPNSGLNLPQEDNFTNNNTLNNVANTNPYLGGTHAQDNQGQRQNPFQKYQQQEYQQSQQVYQQSQQPQSQDVQKDLQIIIAKLDTLRAEMQSISHRIENLERNQKKMW